MNELDYFKRAITAVCLEAGSDLLWSDNTGTIQPWICVNDIFWWGTADGETIEIEDLEALEAAINQAGRDGPLLWAARKRNLRPQGACMEYFKPETVTLLLELPEREIDICNPKGIDGVYKYKISGEGDNR